MGRPEVIIDAGPIVAFLSERESSHREVCATFERLEAPFLTSESVLTEAFFLVARHPKGHPRLFDLLDTGILEIGYSVQRDIRHLRKLMEKYRTLPMSLADATLVRLAELNPEANIFTLDSHFQVYRKNGTEVIPLVLPLSQGS